MYDTGLGAGLAALAFWGFIASVVVAGMWYDLRKRQSQQETVRRIIESGQTIDQEIVDKLLDLSEGGNKALDKEFKVAGLWILPVAVGMLFLGLILGSQYTEAMGPLLGVSALLACLGVGFLMASRYIARSHKTDGNSRE